MVLSGRRRINFIWEKCSIYNNLTRRIAFYQARISLVKNMLLALISETLSFSPSVYSCILGREPRIRLLQVRQPCKEAQESNKSQEIAWRPLKSTPALGWLHSLLTVVFHGHFWHWRCSCWSKGSPLNTTKFFLWREGFSFISVNPALCSCLSLATHGKALNSFIWRNWGWCWGRWFIAGAIGWRFGSFRGGCGYIRCCLTRIRALLSLLRLGRCPAGSADSQ